LRDFHQIILILSNWPKEYDLMTTVRLS